MNALLRLAGFLMLVGAAVAFHRKTTFRLTRGPTDS